MAKTTAVKEHVQAFYDSLESAHQKHEDDAKSAIRSALGHLEAARQVVGSHIKGEVQNDQTYRKKTLEHMNAVVQETQKALEESGAHMRTTIRHIIDATEKILTKDL